MLALNPEVPFMFLQPLAIFSLSLFLSFYWWASRPSIPPTPITPPLLSSTPSPSPPHHDHFPPSIPVMISFLDALGKCWASESVMAAIRPRRVVEELWLDVPSLSRVVAVLIPVANHLLVCCYLNKFTGNPCTLSLFWSLFLWNSNIWVLKSLFLKSSWLAACLISSGSLFHLSTVPTKNENFLWSVIMVSVNAGWPVPDPDPACQVWYLFRIQSM